MHKNAPWQKFQLEWTSEKFMDKKLRAKYFHHLLKWSALAIKTFTSYFKWGYKFWFSLK